MIIRSSNPASGNILRQNYSSKNTRTVLLLAALSKREQKHRNKLNDPSTDEDREDVARVHSGVLHNHKKERNNDICSNMDGSEEHHK